MDHNLILPFILHEAGTTVNDNSIIHLNKPCIDDNAIIFLNSDLIIWLHLHGTFSYFSTRMPTPDDILNPAYRVVFITSEGASCNPQCTSYQLNEETHIDYYVNLTKPRHRTPHMIKDDDIYLDYAHAMAAEVNVPSDFFPDKSYLIDNIITSIPRFATLERSPWDKLLYSQADTCI